MCKSVTHSRKPLPLNVLRRKDQAVSLIVGFFRLEEEPARRVLSKVEHRAEHSLLFERVRDGYGRDVIWDGEMCNSIPRWGGRGGDLITFGL